MIQFIVHDEDDSVGVVTVEGLKANDTIQGWIMDQDVLIDIKINQDIPIGHKLAIKNLNEDDTVIKYGVDIGRTISKIRFLYFWFNNWIHTEIFSQKENLF